MGFLSALSRVCLDMCVVTLLILWLPGFPPYTTFTQFEFPASPPWNGALERNQKLNTVERLFENQIKGPESFAIRDGFLYTGLMSGVIVRIDPEDLSITPVARIGEACAGQHEDFKCGRPLGLAFTSTGKLLVTDAVLGLYLIDLDRPNESEGRITSYKTFDRVSYEQLLSPDTLVEGIENVVFNSVAIGADNRTVYLTVSSTRFPLRDSMFEMVSDASGRVLQFDIETKETKVLVSSINFANGLELAQDESYLIFCETGRATIHKYYLKGEKAGTAEILTTSLPGLPDNIKLNERGNYYVGLITPRLPNTWHILELVAPHNLVRKFISRLICMALVPSKFINQMLPTSVTLKFEYWCGNLEPFAHLSPPYGLVIELDGDSGDIVSSLHSTNGQARFISEAVALDRWLYLGSPYTNYLARVPLRFAEPKSQESDEETRPIHEDAIKDDTSEDIEVEDDEAVIEDILD